MTMHISDLTMGRVVSVFYDDGVVVTGMVSDIRCTYAVVDVLNSNSPAYINATVTIRGNAVHDSVAGKNGWYLPE